jgi:hypothetical protein
MRPVTQAREAVPAGQLQHRVEQVVLWLRPNGWQGRARRNAWSAMVADSQSRQSRMLVAREIGPVDRPHEAVAPVAIVPAARAR